MILDEAMASVDADNESYIQEAITELVKGKTLLIIAHRLNTIRSAEQILVIRDGRSVERGTHDQLMQTQGIYQDFVRMLGSGRINRPQPHKINQIRSATKKQFQSV